MTITRTTKGRDSNLAATNIPLGTTITVTEIPQFGATTSATSTTLAGTLANSTATANLTLPIGTGTAVVLMAQATFNLQLAGLDLPTFNGEKFVQVKVGATMGGSSTLTYISESGREVPANEVGPLVYAKLEGSGVRR